MSNQEQDRKTYTARCHCNATIFEVTIPPLETGATTVNQCNCSICTKKGYATVYPLREDVKFLKGWDELKDYYFGNKTRPHKFCANCGTNIGIDFKDVADEGMGQGLNKRLGISIRTFDGIEDLLSEGKITFRAFDGKKLLGPEYEPLSASLN